MDRSRQVIDVIKDNPGIKFREIMRETGMKNGVLSYYTRKLEEHGVISVERSTRLTRFYPLGIDKGEFTLIANLRQETPKNILVALLENNALTFSELCTRVKRSQSTVSFYLTQLVQDEIVISRRSYLKRIFEIKDRKLVAQIINKYHPNIIERSSDRIADIFSSI